VHFDLEVNHVGRCHGRSNQSGDEGSILITGHPVLSRVLDALDGGMIGNGSLFLEHYDTKGTNDWRRHCGLVRDLAMEAICG